MRARLLNLLTLAVSLALSLAATEAVFGLLNRRSGSAPAESDEAPGPGTELSRFTAYHPLLGHDGRPNVRGTFGRKLVTHNSHGNRGPETTYEKPSGVRRVVVLGDSQAWGYGVHDDETIAARLSELLNAGRSGRYEVLNLGISGYGTDQAFLKFLVQGLRYAPDEVVLVVFKNDAHENESTVAWGVEKPRFFLKDGSLCLGNVPPPKARGWPEDRIVGEDAGERPWRWLDLRRTQAYRFLAGRQWRFSFGAARPAEGDSLDAVRRYVDCIENRPEYPGGGEEILVRLVLALERACREHGARLTVFFTPKPSEMERPAAPPYYAAFVESFARAGIPVVDFREFVVRHAAARELFGHDDPHLSASGSLEAARALQQAIAAGS